MRPLGGIVLGLAAALLVFAPSGAWAQAPSATTAPPGAPTPSLGMTTSGTMATSPPIGVTKTTVIVAPPGTTTTITRTPTTATITLTPPGSSASSLTATFPQAAAPLAMAPSLPLGRDVAPPTCALAEAFDACTIPW